jgi:hypothetical protein
MPDDALRIQTKRFDFLRGDDHGHHAFVLMAQ